MSGSAGAFAGCRAAGVESPFVPELVVTLPSGVTSRHVLGEMPVVLGRETICDVFIDDPSTSRQHARLRPTPEGFLAEDLGSKNGTLVNGEPARSQLLRHGDVLTLGQVLIDYLDEATASAKTVVVADVQESRSRATTFAGPDQALLLSQKRLSKLYELGGQLTRLRTDRTAFLEEALDICFELLSFERGAIGVRRQQTRAVDWPVVRNLHGREGELTISRTLLSRALEHGERAIFTDEGLAAHDPTVSIVQHGIQSAMCVPLIHEDEILGVIYGDRTSSSTRYAQEDIDFLAAIARQISIGLINLRLVDEQKRLAQISYDLDMARRIQRGLFPAALPSQGRLKVAALNEPGRRISGDYYDVIELPDGRVWLLIADVTGEGMPAALLMANLQAAVRLTIHESDDPGALLARWNRVICANTDGSKFVTCLLALVDPAARELSLATAGHYPPILFRAAESEPIDFEVDPGCPLGVNLGETYAAARVPFGREPMTYFCYTDGIVEAMTVDRRQFGEDRLLECLRGARADGPQTLIKQVRRAVSQFVDGAPQSDDITILAAAVS